MFSSAGNMAVKEMNNTMIGNGDNRGSTAVATVRSRRG